MSQRAIEFLVGLFLLIALMALSILAFKVSGLTNLIPTSSYTVIAQFDEIGGLKVRSPVKIGGVQIGEVAKIELDPETFKAKVLLRIQEKYRDIPDDSTAGIYTTGLLGDNYISISPMYNKTFLKDHSEIQITRSAMILENLIGQLIYKLGNSTSDNAATSDDASKNNQVATADVKPNDEKGGQPDEDTKTSIQ